MMVFSFRFLGIEKGNRFLAIAFVWVDICFYVLLALCTTLKPYFWAASAPR